MCTSVVANSLISYHKKTGSQIKSTCGRWDTLSIFCHSFVCRKLPLSIRNLIYSSQVDAEVFWSCQCDNILVREVFEGNNNNKNLVLLRSDQVNETVFIDVVDGEIVSIWQTATLSMTPIFFQLKAFPVCINLTRYGLSFLVLPALSKNKGRFAAPSSLEDNVCSLRQ